MFYLTSSVFLKELLVVNRLILYPYVNLHSFIGFNVFLLFSLVTRVQTTMRGSADDIGWLQKMPNSLPMVDGTSGFLEALDMIRLVVFTPG